MEEIELTEDDFQINEYKDDHPYPWDLSIISLDDEEQCEALQKQILQDQKLRELVYERIEILSRPDAPDSRVVKVVLNVCEKLLEDCKK